MSLEQAEEEADSILCPNIRTKRDLTSLCEVFNRETGALIRSTFAYVDEQAIVWFGQTLGIRKYDLTVDNLKRDLRHIPDSTIYPPMTSSVSVVADANRGDLFVKRPKLLCLDDEAETKLVPQMFLEEVEVLEFLKRRQHPNLVRYHGCAVNRGYITGIVLDRYRVILQYRFEDVLDDLNIVACMAGIRAGVEHLHSLGFAHNDLNPLNIALDGNDNPIILDFGSCKRVGELLLSAGTHGWIDELYSSSARQHDESAMDKIEAWLMTERKKAAAKGA